MDAMIDFHSHVLPGIDDGSASVEESIAMLRLEAQQGITHVVATPHFYAHQDSPENFLARRAESESRLRAAMSREAGLPKLLIGAEVYYFPGISNADSIHSLAVEQSNCLLLEMPYTAWNASMYREVEQLYMKQGLYPVIAHIDRYIGLWRNLDIARHLEKLPVVVQANAQFFVHWSTRSMALKMLQKGQIHLLGSDCHNMTTRKPNLGEALAHIHRHLGADVLHRISQCGNAMLNL